ncbi:MULTISPECIES: hypothetical protein [unclassified Nocardioides]|uniref:hypothetical protein n=1 Tax=unclassified Nocardioides TaxID=2615069 RepID=UPI0009F0720B|nr:MULTISPECIES: hypothetical protein [unclassified Nocardioides]GAW51453.1 Clp domain-containing protein [Nocardioides sp. PD653-B2]GAW54114.1 Clp domain-containing protein [Nocardioides sp. PD653]
MGSWWKPWQWSQDSNRAAVVNARAASTELSRRRVERQEIELFLRQHRRVAAATPAATRRPA